jgi:hypothetical protein
MKIYTLENELQRIKTNVNTRDSRMTDLEKLHQDDRNAIQKLKEMTLELERKLQESDASLNAELQTRKRLEAKVQSMEAISTAENRINEGVPPRRLVSSRSNNQLRTSTSRDGLERIHSPLRRTSFNDMFMSEIDNGSVRLTNTTDRQLRMSGENPLGSFNSVTSPRISTQQNTPEKRKANKSSKGLVQDVRETVSTASIVGGEAARQVSEKDEYELSIQRTQQFLKQRLSKGSSVAVKPDASGGEVGTIVHAPTSSGAAFIYNEDDDDDDDAGETVQLSVPKLHPATPPPVRE